MFDSSVEMFELVISELPNHVPEEHNARMREALQILQLTEFVKEIGRQLVVDCEDPLLVVVFADDRLDGLRARHGRLLAHKCRDST